MRAILEIKTWPGTAGPTPQVIAPLWAGLKKPWLGNVAQAKSAANAKSPRIDETQIQVAQDLSDLGCSC